MKLRAHYIIYENHGFYWGYTTSDPYWHLTDACWRHSEARGKGHDSTVFLVEPGAKGRAGAMLDITDQAETKLRQMFHQQKRELPDWLNPRDPEEIEREARIEARTMQMLRKQTEAAQ